MSKTSLKKDQLERELNLKQLQINSLLTITQAINDNVKANGLFSMYTSFLGWEMGVEKMALFYNNDGNWTCATLHGLEQEELNEDIGPELLQYNRTQQLKDVDHPFLQMFELIIPVRHKATPIAYALIGGIGGQDDDLYSRIQFITTITNIIAVAIENKRLFKRQLEQERMKRDLELAVEMQRGLIPKSLPKCGQYELAGIYQPHQGVGGDYYDFIQFQDGKITFCIGDISGKGAAAALLMANFQANVHTLIRRRTSLDKFIRDLNSSLVRTTKGDKFVTFFVAEYDTHTGSLHYINAGHNPPILAMNGSVIKLDKGCTILGTFAELPFVELGQQNILSDAMILTYTDGLTDLQNEEEEYFSEDSLKDFVSTHQKLPAEEFNDLLFETMGNFKGTQAFPDDFSVLTCKIFSILS